MKIWLVNPYGPIPAEGWRLYRYAMLGEELSARGHEVIWWTANFSHHFKKFRSPGWFDIAHGHRFVIRLVPATRYVANVGLGRMRFEVAFAIELLRRARHEPAPDVIVGIDPPQPIGFTCVRLARSFKVPLVLDVMDMWPELFAIALPKRARFVAPLLFAPYRAVRKYNLSRANAVTALCRRYLELALREAPVLSGRPHGITYNGIDVEMFRDEAELGTAAERSSNRVIYAGSLGNNYDLDALLQAAQILERSGSPTRLLIAGDGPRREDVAEFIRTHGLKQVEYLGRLDHNKLAAVYRTCGVGLTPYAPGSNVGMPDKAYDYLAGGLAIVNSLPGELADLLHQSGAGVQYEAGNALSLATVLHELATDQPRWRAMTAAALTLAARFERRVQYHEYGELIERTARAWQARPAHAK